MNGALDRRGAVARRVLALGAALALCAVAARGQQASSASYDLLDYQWDSDGGPSCSLGFAAHAAGQSWAGSLASANYTAAVGFLAAEDPQPTNAPVVFAIAPLHGAVGGGTPVTVSGLNFDRLGSGPTVSMTVGGASATSLTVLSNTQLTANTPAGAMGPADVVVTSMFGSATQSGGYVYSPAVVASPSALIGSGIQVKNYGPLGGVFNLWTSPLTTFIPLPPFGTILIGPSPASQIGSGSYTAPSGIHSASFALPNDPTLHGVAVHFQTVSIQLAPLSITLTNRSTTVIQ